MDHPTCGPGARWCARADKMFAVPGMHVLDVGVEDHDRLVLSVESGQLEAGCPSCGVLGVGHGRRSHMLHDAACFGRTTVLLWRKRVWRCREPLCATDTFSECTSWHRRGRCSPSGRSAGPPTPSPMTTPPSRRWPATSAWTGIPPGPRSRSRPELESPTRPAAECEDSGSRRTDLAAVADRGRPG